LLFLGARAAVLATLGQVAEAETAFEQAEEELRALGDESVLTAVQIHRGHLDLARATAATGDGALAAAHRRAARDRLALAPLGGRPSDDVRFAFRILERAIARAPEAEAIDASVLTISAEGDWFIAPGSSAVVELAHREHLRRLLRALARHRLTAPDRALDLEALFERGWPGERALPRARVSRVHVALTMLRKAGLRDFLHRRSDGYLLDPAVPLIFAGDRVRTHSRD